MKRNGYFTFHMIIDSWAIYSFDAVCVGSPVIIILFYNKVNKQVHKTITRVVTIAHR